MKRIDIIRLATIMALVLMLSSCKDEINLPYSDADKVYFEYEYQDPAWSSTHLIKRDSVTAAMGYLPNGQDRMEVKIPIKLLGSALDKDATYKVEVAEQGTIVTGKTTAIENVHYLPLEDHYTFHSGLLVDTLRITALRSALSSSYSKKENATLVLRIVDGGELGRGLRDGWEMLISMSNFMSEPSWWSTYALGFYHPEKYKILLMFEDESFYASADLLNDSSARRCISAMSNYLEDNVVIDEETGKRIGFDSLINLEEENKEETK